MPIGLDGQFVTSAREGDRELPIRSEGGGWQVRVEGAVERVGDEESLAYFHTRARASQVSAWASPQSRPVADRDVLERRVAEIEQRFAGEAMLPLPPFWGGYRIVAAAIEF